jgi:hypothetical protein
MDEMGAAERVVCGDINLDAIGSFCLKHAKSPLHVTIIAITFFLLHLTVERIEM